MSDKFFNADIQYDLILSYPTLSEHKMGVLPHRNALILEEDAEDECLSKWGEQIAAQHGYLGSNVKAVKIQNVKLSVIDTHIPSEEQHPLQQG